jgi:hypothetical protein
MRADIKDHSWIRQSFMLPERAIADLDHIRRIQTTADFKFTDTSIGGNFALNALPQWTGNADIRRFNFYKGNTGKENSDQIRTSSGMGRFYSEVIDDNAQLIHIKAGVAKFNSLTQFFGNFYSAEASVLARTARSTSVFFDLGRLATSVVTIPLQGLVWAGKFVRFFLEKPSSKYYYLKPAMPLYWNAVTSMVNGIAVNMGVIPRVGGGINDPLTEGVVWSKEQITSIRKTLPDVIRADGGIDIVSVSTRAQRLANAFNEGLEKAMGDAASLDRIGQALAIRKYLNGGGAGDAAARLRAAQKAPFNQKTYLSTFLGEGDAKEGHTMDGYLDQSATAENIQENVKFEQGTLDKMQAFYEAERKQGSSYVTFRVDSTGPASESFSNSAKSSDLAGTINGMSSSSREARFNVADGNIGELGGLGTLLGEFVTAGKDAVAGAASSLSISGIAALAGSAFVDIPDMWDSSTADVGRATYTIPLRAPYGHQYSRLQNLIIPMCALMALALPLSTGKQSYTSPLLLELFSQGRTQIRLGMVESLSFTRGVGETGWLPRGRFMGVDVNITIIDLSKVVHMPINPGFDLMKAGQFALAKGVGEGVNALGGLFGNSNVVNSDGLAAFTMSSSFDDDNKYTDYLSILGSLPLEAQTSSWRKFKLRATQQASEFRSYTSGSHMMNSFMGTMFGDVIMALSSSPVDRK